MIRLTNFHRFHRPLATLITTVILLAGNLAQAGQITLALYPYVPRIEQFKQSIQSRWNQAHPDVDLVFAEDWDGGYSNNPTDAMDVFVFDATFLKQFKSSGYLSPLSAGDISNLGDFVPYAINGMKIGDSYYAIPLLGCTNVMFYLGSDKPVAAATSLSALKTNLNSCTYTSEIPPDRRGLMIKGDSGDNNYRYVEMYYSQYGKFPDNSINLDQAVVSNAKTMLGLGGYLNATTSSSDSYIYANWFSLNYGRTMVGYTESMSAMPAALRSQIAFKPMLFSDKNNSPLFYSDVIGVNSKTKNRTLALALANMLASTDNVVASIGPSGNQSAQYLMPVRTSVFGKLEAADPIYFSIHKMLMQSNPVLFALNENARTWLAQIKTPANTAFWSGYQCGCDMASNPAAADYAQAKQVCPTTCKDHGGWNGQWTNVIPGHPSGCGCNTCPITQ
jgi:thiamine pyridinylase